MEKKYGVWAVRGPGSIFGAAEAWCKDNGVPLEFDTDAEARAYAKKLNDGARTVNVRYYVKEKDPEPIVYIRSAVHSNYVGMVAMVDINDRVYLGKTENYVFTPGKQAYYKNYDGSLCHISDRQDMYYFLYGEGWVHSQVDMLGHGLTMEQYKEFAKLRCGVLKQFEVKREIMFANQPFQDPDNYLRNAELYEEGQTGNYNMITGQIDNKPPARSDMTDGQMNAEICELTPETEKPSVMDKLKTERPEHEERQIITSIPHRDLP